MDGQGELGPYPNRGDLLYGATRNEERRIARRLGLRAWLLRPRTAYSSSRNGKGLPKSRRRAVSFRAVFFARALPFQENLEREAAILYRELSRLRRATDAQRRSLSRSGCDVLFLFCFDVWIFPLCFATRSCGTFAGRFQAVIIGCGAIHGGRSCCKAEEPSLAVQRGRFHGSLSAAEQFIEGLRAYARRRSLGRSGCDVLFPFCLASRRCGTWFNVGRFRAVIFWVRSNSW